MANKKESAANERTSRLVRSSSDLSKDLASSPASPAPGAVLKEQRDNASDRGKEPSDIYDKRFTSPTKQSSFEPRSHAKQAPPGDDDDSDNGPKLYIKACTKISNELKDLLERDVLHRAKKVEDWALFVEAVAADGMYLKNDFIEMMGTETDNGGAGASGPGKPKLILPPVLQWEDTIAKAKWSKITKFSKQ
eukprot:1751136-Karenia_brevis.AAC.1